ncbi:MAG: hypothetical protein FJY54_09355 [Betaproteobacteria bacterium]|nr:hypothetical protein [Betaproteobacteria bacterium]
MQARAVEARRGWQWILDGFGLFRKNPVIWVALTIVLGLMWLLSFIIPVLGPLLFNLLSPVFFAGVLIGCRALEQGEELGVPHLFAGFRQHAAPLVTVGGVYLIGTIIVFGIVFMVAGGSMVLASISKPGVDPATVAAAVRSLALALAVGAAVYIPLLMLIWFAPALVVFKNLAPVAAMKLSFEACRMNVVPFLVYSLGILGLWFVLSLPAGLGRFGMAIGIALLVVSLPVLFCSVYASYKDVFADRTATARGDVPLPR